MLMFLSTLLHSLHLDVQYGQTRHLLTQWSEDWLLASVVNYSIVTNPTILLHMVSCKSFLSL